MRTKRHKVLIPFEPDEAKRTRWHAPANGPTGGKAALHGSFDTSEEAVEWARKNIPGCEYGLRCYETETPDPVPPGPEGPLADGLKKWAARRP